jgi:monooxygenase
MSVDVEDCEHYDVAIVGAGLSGIGAAHHLQQRLPGKRYAIFEARAGLGGTWDLFRYPGIRSDSDMHTLGYEFRPWEGAKAIADGPAILRYIADTARAAGIDRRIHFRWRVTRARWSSEQARWMLTLERTTGGDGTEMTGEAREVSCSFLFCCTGYYRYDHGYEPKFPGAEDYCGAVIHPQHWPEQLDCAGKRIVVIGSGSTAVTLVPALAARGAHVTMVQRTPTYVISLPAEDRLALALRRRLPARLAYRLTRAKNVLAMVLSYQFCRRWPALARRAIRVATQRELPADVDVDVHFNPPYKPWDQRLCVVPDGDLFRALRERRVTLVTDRVERFTEGGLRLVSGRELKADVIVTATGLDLLALGGIEFEVDGREVDLAASVAYRGMMLAGVPNMAFAMGYTNASWTLKCDLTCAFVCRVLAHMEAHGYAQVAPRLSDPGVELRPFIDDLSSGYILRALDRFPKQGSRRPWRLHQNYLLDRLELARARLDDGALQFSRAPARALAAR